MKKILSIALMLSLISACGQKQLSPKKIVEDGVEVILNQQEPYTLEGLASNLNLEQVITIDTERNEILDTGLVDIETFDVDNDRNIYIISWTTKENFVYKFNRQGEFVKSFVRKGQGPGEIEWGGSVMFTGKNELRIKDPSKTRYSVYNTEGEFLRDVTFKTHISTLKVFDNGKLFVFWQDEPTDGEKFINHLGICESGFENIKEIYSYSFPNVMVVEKVYAPGNFWIEGASKDHIFIGDGELGYEILVFDLEGHMIRKIRRKYEPVSLSEEYRKDFFERRKKSPVLDKYVLRKHFPPFQYLFTDEENRIFVMTYENGTGLNEWIFDIFTPDGIFCGRVPIKSRIYIREITISTKQDHLCSLCEKESGYKALVVYRMNWE